MSQETIDGFLEMYNSLKDPEKRADAKRRADRITRAEQRRKDTGL